MCYITICLKKHLMNIYVLMIYAIHFQKILMPTYLSPITHSWKWCINCDYHYYYLLLYESLLCWFWSIKSTVAKCMRFGKHFGVKVFNFKCLAGKFLSSRLSDTLNLNVKIWKFLYPSFTHILVPLFKRKIFSQPFSNFSKSLFLVMKGYQLWLNPLKTYVHTTRW